ncbi:MAG: cardiolipin synthase [Clostridia bacterium]|nr:cardiolipin synthase [Clostridia bacterium]
MNKKPALRYGLPTRIIAAAVLILIQITMLVAIVYAASLKALWVYIPLQIVSVIAVIYIVNRRGNPSFKLTWIIFILLAPLFGGLIFLLWGGGKTTPKFKKRWIAISSKLKDSLRQDDKVVSKLEYNHMHYARQSSYLYNESGFPVYDGTHTTFYPTGEEFFIAVIEELEAAQKFIFIEFFILAEGELWNRIYKVLRKKIKQGVEVRIIYDDFGSLKRQQEDFDKKLRRQGFKVSVFNPIRPSVDLFLNNRNHRKIIVVDGKVSFTGGLNIGDEYVNIEQPFGHWCDCGVRLAGKATESFTVMFCNMWNTTNPDDIISPKKHFADYFVPAVGFVQPYCDDPLTPHNPAEGLYMQMINNAQRYLYIATPYLILDNTMITQLILAAKAGVDVRIITPKKWDKWYVHPVTQYYYDELLEAGIRIYEYTPGFIHSKIFVSDDTVATIGTVNVDYRSFYFHFECGTWLCGSEAVVDIKAHYSDLLERSEEIKLEKWKRRPVLQKFKQIILHIFAPFM